MSAPINHLLLHQNSRLAFSFTLRYTTPVALDTFGAV